MERKSWRPAGFAQRHSVSLAFIYKQIALGLLNARKAAGVTIITDQDEADWLAAMPSVKGNAGKAA